jgi:signal transduction histidine kinase
LTAGVAKQIASGFEAVEGRVAAVLGDPAASPPSPGGGALEAVLDEARRGRETIEGLQELALDEAILPGPVNLAELIESARRIVRHLMTSAGVSFSAELPEGMAPVRGTFGQLRLVFVNLLYNAVQAMPRGGALTVRAGFLGGKRVEITVADQGVGIAREDLPHVLEPFYSPNQGARILGPGLSVSHSVVRKLGGDIRVESVVGQGTTVHVTLPLAG